MTTRLAYASSRLDKHGRWMALCRFLGGFSVNFFTREGGVVYSNSVLAVFVGKYKFNHIFYEGSDYPRHAPLAS